jgi:hypothetical protein
MYIIGLCLLCDGVKQLIKFIYYMYCIKHYKFCIRGNPEEEEDYMYMNKWVAKQIRKHSPS